MQTATLAALLWSAGLVGAFWGPEPDDAPPEPADETIADAIRRAVAEQAAKNVHEHLNTLNTTATHFMTSTDANVATARLAVFLGLGLFVAALALWCVCLAIKSAFRWLVNLVLLMAAVYLFFLIVEYLSVKFQWFAGTSLGGSTA